MDGTHVLTLTLTLTVHLIYATHVMRIHDTGERYLTVIRDIVKVHALVSGSGA